MKKSVVLLLSCVVVARAGVVTWVGGSGDAGVAGNWDTGVVPGASDDVVIGDAVGPQVVTVSADVSWKTLTVQQSTANAGENVLSVADGVSLTLNNARTNFWFQGAEGAPAVLQIGAGAFVKGAGNAWFLEEGSVLRGSGTLQFTGSPIFTVKGTLAGPTIAGDAGHKTLRMMLEPTACVRGEQTWKVGRYRGGLDDKALVIRIADPEQWENDVVSYEVATGNGMNMEAATSSVSPSTDGNFRFKSIKLSNSNMFQARLNNDAQNDGTAFGEKEAVYAKAWTGTTNFRLDLNGQDMYVDRFRDMVSFDKGGMIFMNGATNTTSVIRALGEQGDTLVGGGFTVMNEAALEVRGGPWRNLISTRHNYGYPSDASAVYDIKGGFNNNWLRRWDGIDVSGVQMGFLSFLGSGSAMSKNARDANSGGTVRVVGGGYVSSSYMLNPIGVSGLIDTTLDGEDDQFDSIVVRALSWRTIQECDPETGLFSVTNHPFEVGTVVAFQGGINDHAFTSNMANYSGLSARFPYYVVEATPDTFRISDTPNGAPLSLLRTIRGCMVFDMNKVADETSQPALIVGGHTTIRGHLQLRTIVGSWWPDLFTCAQTPYRQATLRVGGVEPVARAVVADVATSTFLLAGCDLEEDQPIFLGGKTVPTGLKQGDPYYAVNVTEGSFQVAAYPGQPAMAFTSAGDTVSVVVPRVSGEAVLDVEGDFKTDALMNEGHLHRLNDRGDFRPHRVKAVVGDGEVVTVETHLVHNLVPGDEITVALASNTGFNGTWTIETVPTLKSFTYRAPVSAAEPSNSQVYMQYKKPLSVNVALQENGTLRVGGDVAIGGVGVRQPEFVTGMGVGIHPQSQIVLTGGYSASPKVDVVPPVGQFAVGEAEGVPVAAALMSDLTVAGRLTVSDGCSLVASGEEAALRVVGEGVVDLSEGMGYVEVTGLEFEDSGKVDFGKRVMEPGLLRVKGDTIEAMYDAIAEGRITHRNASLLPRYVRAEDYTTVVGNPGLRIFIR